MFGVYRVAKYHEVYASLGRKTRLMEYMLALSYWILSISIRNESVANLIRK